MTETQSGGRVRGKVALITGGASGIGRATALLLAREGSRVAVADINDAGARQVAGEIHAAGGQAEAVMLDVTSETSVEQVIARVKDLWGGLHVVVAAAGVASDKAIADQTLEEWRRVMAVNLDGVFLSVKHAIRVMRGGTGGSIIVVSSAAGLRTFPGAAAYSTSKAALRMMAKTAALECARAGHAIRVNSIHPGGVETPIWWTMPFFAKLREEAGSDEEAFRRIGQAQPLKRLARPEEIAAAILFLASDESSYVTGSEMVIDGGLSA